MQTMHANYQAGICTGDAVSNNNRKSQVQSSVAGLAMTMASSPWNGCGDIQLRIYLR